MTAVTSSIELLVSSDPNDALLFSVRSVFWICFQSLLVKPYREISDAVRYSFSTFQSSKTNGIMICCRVTCDNRVSITDVRYVACMDIPSGHCADWNNYTHKT